jgi:hypothetical protein
MRLAGRVAWNVDRITLLGLCLCHAAADLGYVDIHQFTRLTRPLAANLRSDLLVSRSMLCRYTILSNEMTDKRIRQRATRFNCSRGIKPCWLDVLRSQDVEHTFARSDKIVSNDPSVASPPDGLRAHGHTCRGVSHFAQPRQTGSKFIAQGIIGVVVKPLIFPKRIQFSRHIATSQAKPAKRRDVLIPI